MIDRALVVLAVVLSLVAGALVVRGPTPPDVAPPVPLGDRKGAAPKKLPPARAVPQAPRGPRPVLPVRPDGLVIWDVVQGTGDPLADGLVAVIEYTGYLPDGTPFDSSYERPGPTRIRTGSRKILPGWDVGLPGLREGGTRQVVVPPALAFGPRGLPGQVPGGATVTYDFELLEVITIPTAPAAVPPDGYRELALPPTPTARSPVRVHDLVVGDGAPLDDGRTATVDYLVWAPDGALVDTSFDRPAPFTFRYGEGAVAWEGGLAGMAVGGRRQLVLPPDRGFGAKGKPPFVPPDATLVLEVALRGVE